MSITINPATTKPPTRDNANPPTHLPVAKNERQHPSKAGGENASVYFVGTATTILWVCVLSPVPMGTDLMTQRMGGNSSLDRREFLLLWRAIIHRILILTQPNFLHAGDHVHLGPGVSSTRLTNPSVDLHDLPRIDLVLLSHYHA